jgi:ADP-heptose:LPS heptosyltransferase
LGIDSVDSSGSQGGIALTAKSVLIYRIGSLGDTLVALPALWAIREHFKHARITLLFDYHPGKRNVLASDLLSGSGVVDEFMRYRVDPTRKGKLLAPLHLAKLVLSLRRRRFDALVYLPPSGRNPPQVERDRRFFGRLAGIRNIIGMDVDLRYPSRPAPGVMIPHEADQLLSHIANGIPVPSPGQGRMDLALTPKDDEPVKAWLSRLDTDGGRPWVGVGPGSRMLAKIWPRERFRDVLRDLIARFDVWPVIFGGPEDRAVGQWLIDQLGHGYVAAGELGLRPSASALSRCRLYLGNDTGTMHMAAAVGVPCVAIFSARTWPGMWFPYGPHHRPFQADIDCVGCMLFECVERRMECVMRISVEQVRDACVEILCNRLAPTAPPTPE